MKILLILLSVLYLAKGFQVAEAETAKYGHHPMWVLVVVLWPIVRQDNDNS